jgi:hypothetical protein
MGERHATHKALLAEHFVMLRYFAQYASRPYYSYTVVLVLHSANEAHRTANAGVPPLRAQHMSQINSDDGIAITTVAVQSCLPSMMIIVVLAEVCKGGRKCRFVLVIGKLKRTLKSFVLSLFFFIHRCQRVSFLPFYRLFSLLFLVASGSKWLTIGIPRVLLKTPFPVFLLRAS